MKMWTPTIYDGVEYRSYLDASYAMFLDEEFPVCRLHQYEMRAIQLDSTHWYTPDFWAWYTAVPLIIEVKPDEEEAIDDDRMPRLSRVYPKSRPAIFVVAFGPPRNCGIITYDRGGELVDIEYATTLTEYVFHRAFTYDTR